MERFLRFFIETAFRTIPGPFLISLVFFSVHFLGYFFDALKIGEYFPGPPLKPITLDFIFNNFERSMILFLVLFISHLLIDIFASPISKQVYRAKLFIIRRVKIPSILIDSLKNTTTISVRDLDEFLKGVYDRCKGKIVLYNPDVEMFSGNADVAKVINRKLKDNSIEKLEIHISPEQEGEFNLFKSGLDDDISKRVEILLDITDGHSSRCYRKAVYYSAAGKGNFDIYYFMLRPIIPPYSDKYVIIKKGVDLRELRSGYESLYGQIA